MEWSFNHLKVGKLIRVALWRVWLRHLAANWQIMNLKMNGMAKICLSSMIQTMITNLLTTSVTILVIIKHMTLTEVAILITTPGSDPRMITTSGSQIGVNHMPHIRTIGSHSTIIPDTITTCSKCQDNMTQWDTFKNRKCNITKKCQPIRKLITGMGSLDPTGTNKGIPWVSRLTTEGTGMDQMEVELKADISTTQENTIDD